MLPELPRGLRMTFEWLVAERRYQTLKFDYDEERAGVADPESDDYGPEYWEQQFDSYIQRLRVFPQGSLQYKQAALKLAATVVSLCEYMADTGELPTPGVPSGEVIPWSQSPSQTSGSESSSEL
jgi:hypothetical protein